MPGKVAINPKFTPAQYEAYCKKEDWEYDLDDDGTPLFKSEYERDAYFVACVDRWMESSREHFRATKKEWAYAIMRFERFTERMKELSSAQADPAYTQLPFLFKALLELVALLFDTLPRPQYVSRQATEDEFTSAMNYCGNWEMDADDFDMKMYDIGLDVQLCNLGILKQTIDPNQSGPFNKEKRIVSRRIEPRYFHPDPLAQKADWEYCKYWIFSEPMDLSDIRTLYPMKGFNVTQEAAYSTTRVDSEYGERQDEGDAHIIRSPANAMGGPLTVGERGRAMLKECWLKDKTVYFVADTEWVDNMGTDEAGNSKEITAGEGTTYERLKVDDDGYVVGSWKPRYPNGRMIVTAHGELLCDIPNPFRHKVPPYTLFRGRPSKGVLSPGNATFLIIVEKKLNDIYLRVMQMAQANTEQPTIIDQGAFDAPKKWQNVEGTSATILQVRPGARVAKMIAAEIPNFVYPFASFLKTFFDDLMGIQAIMRGQLQDGAQLAAQTVGQLQDMAGTRNRMSARYLENGLEKYGYQLMWNMRQTYPGSLKVTIIDPVTKKPKEVTWDDEAMQDDYAVVIQAGSSLPGAKEGSGKLMERLYDRKIVGPGAVLDAYQVPGKERLLAEQKQREEEQIKAQAAGRALGLQIKELTKPDDKAGRKEQG